jgi:hypothetical protein
MLYVILTEGGCSPTFESAREALAYYESLPQVPPPRIGAGIFHEAFALGELRDEAKVEGFNATFLVDHAWARQAAESPVIDELRDVIAVSAC